MKKIGIIDDEVLARTLIKEYLEKHPDLKVVFEVENGFEAAKEIAQTQPDLIFLDIQMPKINGFELLEIIQEKPAVIFTTAYDDYALKAFETQALDYLLKPFSQSRFDQAIAKWKTHQSGNSLKNLSETVHKQPEESMRIVVKDGSEIVIISTEEVDFLEANGDYVKIHHRGKTHLKNKTMSYYEKTLDGHQFMRIHRSYILNLKQLTKIESYEKNAYIAILKTGDKIPISRNSYALLKEKLGI